MKGLKNYSENFLMSFGFSALGSDKDFWVLNIYQMFYPRKDIIKIVWAHLSTSGMKGLRNVANRWPVLYYC